jgi:hypothetical protein
MKKIFNILILIICFYSLLTIIKISDAFISNASQITGSVSLLVLVLLISLIMVVSNILILSGNRNSKLLVKVNLVFLLLQVVHIKCFGFVYEYSTMSEFLVYFISNDSVTNVGYTFDFLPVTLRVLYNNSMEGFIVALNIVPLVLYAILNEVKLSAIYK